MKFSYLPIVLLLLLPTLGVAQFYTLNVSVGTYNNLASPISINNGETWDDPIYSVPIDFEFLFFGNPLSNLMLDGDIGLGGVLSGQTPGTGAGIVSILGFFDADLIDRGFLSNTSESPISYEVDGFPGSRILKLELKNAGFYSELFDDNESTDFINIQLWLYEGSNDFEIHFGPNSIEQPDLSYDEEGGPFMYLAREIDIDSYDPAESFLIVQGDPTFPELVDLEPGQYPEVLNGTPPDGTIYTFRSAVTNVEEVASDNQVRLFPNPATFEVNLRLDESIQLIDDIQLVNSNGAVVRTTTSTTTVDLTNLSPGFYWFRFPTQDGWLTKKLIIAK